MSAKRRRERKIRRILVFIIAVLLAVLLICGMAAGYIWLSVKLPSLSMPEKYSVYYGAESTSVSRMDYATYKRGQFGDKDIIYVNFSAIAGFCGFYVSGDSSRLRFILPAVNGSEDSEFTVRTGSSEIDFGGTTGHLNAPAVMEGETLYMPVDFIETYIEGISVGMDDKRKNAYVLRCSDEGIFYLNASGQLPNSEIDRTALEGENG